MRCGHAARGIHGRGLRTGSAGLGSVWSAPRGSPRGWWGSRLQARPRGDLVPGIHGRSSHRCCHVGQPRPADLRAPEVTVVGAGPVGMTVAALLGARGRQVHVIERRPGPVTQPRAVHLDHHAARILDAAGVMVDLLPRTEAMDVYEWRNGTGEVLLQIRPPHRLGRSGWPESLMFSQPDLEDALATRLDGMATVRVERGRSVDDLGALGDLGEGWVVACDGANSTVRELLGVGFNDEGYNFEWIVVDVVERRPQRWAPCNVQFCDPARPTTAVSGGPGRRRWEFMVLPGESSTELATEESAWRLLARWDVHPANARLERHAMYSFGARIVERWGAGRVLLAGDAAHQMPPFAGQGLCSGLRDAANLSWKLDLVLAGSVAPTLMDTYGSERDPQARSEIDFSVELGRIICVLDPEQAEVRDRDMSAAAKATGPMAPPPLPPLGPGMLLPDDPLSGQLAVQGEMTLAGRHGRTDQVLGRGWVLHGRRGDPRAHLSAASAAWWSGMGGLCLDCSEAPAPYPDWFEETGAEVILVRPDFAVFGSAKELPGADGLVRALRRRIEAFGVEGHE